MILRKNLKNIVNKKQKLLLLFLLISSIILSVFEMIGIGAIGIFVAILSDSQSFIQKIPFEKIQFFLENIEVDKLIILFGITLTLIFLFKNLLVIIYNFLELKTRNNINLDISKKIYSNYLYRDISFHNNKNPAELVNIVNSVTNTATQYLFAIIIFF